MRTFRVEGPWEHGMVQCLLTRRGSEGLGVYFGDSLVLSLSHKLATIFEDPDVLAVALRCARLDGWVLSTPPQGEVDRLDGSYGPCLVHAAVLAHGGRVIYTASTYAEMEVPVGRGGLLRVEREYHPIDQAMGVRSVAVVDNHHDELFVLWPGASFRIVREGRQEDPMVLHVRYDGRKLFVDERGRKRRALRERREETAQALTLS